jgi:Pyruvate/2-oxoacid:ferredoxin oxidoreductase delta subunit
METNDELEQKGEHTVTVRVTNKKKTVSIDGIVYYTDDFWEDTENGTKYLYHKITPDNNQHPPKTIKYPSHDSPSTILNYSHTNYVQMNGELCVFCDACIPVCPDHDIEKDRSSKHVPSFKNVTCSGCLECFYVCPADAIDKIR